MSTDSTRRFTFRVPESLFLEIEEQAKKNHRSVNSEIVVILEDFLKNYQFEHSEIEE